MFLRYSIVYRLATLIVGISQTLAVIVDDTDARIAYDASWIFDSNAMNYNASAHRASVPGAKATFEFIGTAITMYAVTHNDGADFELSLGDDVSKSCTTYADSDAWLFGVAVCTLDNLAASTLHILSIQHSGIDGRWVGIDFFDVTSNDAPPSPSRSFVSASATSTPSTLSIPSATPTQSSSFPPSLTSTADPSLHTPLENSTPSITSSLSAIMPSGSDGETSASSSDNVPSTSFAPSSSTAMPSRSGGTIPPFSSDVRAVTTRALVGGGIAGLVLLASIAAFILLLGKGKRRTTIRNDHATDESDTSSARVLLSSEPSFEKDGVRSNEELPVSITYSTPHKYPFLPEPDSASILTRAYAGPGVSRYTDSRSRLFDDAF